MKALKDALAAAKAATEASSLLRAADHAGTAVDAAAAAAGNRRGSRDAVVGSGNNEQEEGVTAHTAKELKNAERELENLREREKDARGEANRTAEDLERFRYAAWVYLDANKCC